MERKSQVLDVKVEHDGTVHRASYFVEEATIYTSIGGHVLIAPLGKAPAADTVKSLLSGHLQRRSLKLKQSGRWGRVQAQ